MKTASGLVDYAKAQLGLPYWWGGYGQTANQSLLNQMKSQYPDVYNTDYYSNATSQFGKRVHDCVGLVKGYRWSETPTTPPIYVASQDVAVPGLYNQCTQRGTIRQMGEVPGACVFMADMSHVGVYIGDGYVIEAQNHANGVVKTKLEGRGWAVYGCPDWINYGFVPDSSVDYTDYYSQLPDYDKKTVETWPTISRGMSGGYVGALQMLLTVIGGINTEVDGNFGPATRGNLIEYQNQRDLEPDGVCGTQTWSSFFV